MVNSVRAKFAVERVESNGEYAVVELRAVTRDDTPENKAFWKYTPSGFVQMTITNPDAVGFFEVRQEYYLDFIPAGE
jgi:hypothetical protein